MFKYVDISGFGHSGKSVMTDIFKEFEGYQVPHYNFEFNLLRIQGGLIDLCEALGDNWSPIRSDIAIRRFINIVNRLGIKATIKKPYSLFIASGMNYDEYFNGKFISISESFLNSIINYSYIGDWPYPIIDEPIIKQFIQRLKSNILKKNIFRRKVYFSAPNDIIGSTKKYINQLFTTIAKKDTCSFVLHNAIEPFNPVRGLDCIENAKTIIVQRDPRDIYASMFIKDGAFIPSFEKRHYWSMKSDFLNSDDINRFILRQKIQLSKINYQNDDNRVMRIRYEDLVVNYPDSLSRVIGFLGEKSSIHINKGKYYDPKLSVKNVGLWKKATGKVAKDIELICNQLPATTFF